MRQLSQKKDGTVPLHFCKNPSYQFLILNRDAMGSNLSVVNAIVLLGLKIASTLLVRNDPKFRF
jgi:hypothetical protein